MAERASESDGGKLLRRTVMGVADFSGRSRRLEVFCYWFASMVLTGFLIPGLQMVLSLRASIPFAYALYLLIALPTFALFVRRLHDQNRSAWWGLLWPVALLFNVPKMSARLHGDIGAIIAAGSSLPGIAAGICGLAVFIFCLLPGSIGDNRYGPDPRLGAG